MENQVMQYIRQHGLPLVPVFTGEDTSTVHKAAEVLGVEDGQIAKSLAMRLPQGAIIVVAMGTARLDNQKYKATFGVKPKMLSGEETLAETGFAPGGVSPLGLPPDVKVYLDASLRRYTHVYPAAGTADSAVEIELARLAEYTGGEWVDVCKIPD